MRCCQSTCQEITMQAGLALQRCGTCGAQSWTRDGRQLTRSEAFAVLARSYQDAPARNRAAHQAAVAAGAARRAQRAALTAREARRPALPGAAQADRAVVLPADLLAGWTVLGASA